jgi:MFS family permease
MALLALVSGDLRIVFWIALIPGALAVITLLFSVEEPKRTAPATPPRFPLSWVRLRDFDRAYWTVVVIGVLFTLARFSEAFLVLRGQDAGLSLTFLPAILIVMNVVYAVSALPAGRLSDRLDRRFVLAGGLITLIGADVVLALWATIPGVLIGAALWGLHMGFTQGLFAAMVADTSPPDLRGTAFGLFNLISGIALFAASLIAGVLWDVAGPSATFLGGALFAAITALGLLSTVGRRA